MRSWVRKRPNKRITWTIFCQFTYYSLLLCLFAERRVAKNAMAIKIQQTPNCIWRRAFWNVNYLKLISKPLSIFQLDWTTTNGWLRTVSNRINRTLHYLSLILFLFTRILIYLHCFVGYLRHSWEIE